MQHYFADPIEDEDEVPVQTVRTTTPKVTSTLGAPRHARPSAPAARPSAASHLLAGTEEAWTARQLQDYVLERMARTTKARSVMPGDRMASVFKSFVSRHPDARQIAEWAFEGQLEPGWWNNAPITPYSFCVKADAYFALPIRGKLNS